MSERERRVGASIRSANSTAMVVVHPHTLDGKIRGEAALTDPRGKTLAKLSKGTVVKILLKSNTQLQVEVITGDHRGKQGWILASQYEVD